MSFSKLLLVVNIVLLMACNTNDDQPMIAMEVPPGFPQPRYNAKNNVITKAGFELGRALFYDGMLSRDGSVSCGNCHQQSAAFSHQGHIVSHGIDDRMGTRNAPALMNLAWQSDFFWDGGVHDLDLQPLAPIENPLEMDEDVSVVLERLRADSYYQGKFKDAFGSPDITTEYFLKALSQFMIMLVSAHSRYDGYMQSKGDTLSVQELEGLTLFKQKCASCHSSELFTDLSYRDNGLDETNKADLGRYTLTLNDNDRYKFKVPSLRNVEITAPYMHDGRFRSLEMVLDHYADNVHDNANLDPSLKQDNRRGIPMTAADKAKIILFLKTLTDREFITNKLFSESSKK